MNKYNILNLNICLTLLFFSLSSFSQTLLPPKIEKDGVVYGKMCSRSSADTFPVSFSFSGDEFESSNVFSVELSDANGGWDSPVNLKTITGENTSYNVSTSITLPTDAYGKNYRIRIRSTSPPQVGPDSETSFEAFYIGNVQSPILNNSENLVLCQGESKEVSLDDDSKTYIWYKNNIEIQGESSSKLVIDSPGTYYAKPDYGSCISVFSNTINVTVFSSQEISLKGDSEVVLCGDKSYTFESTFTNTRDFEYKWYKDDKIIEGATAPTYTTPTNNQFGVYQVVLKPKSNNTCESKSQKVKLSQKKGNDFEVKVESASEMIILPIGNQIVKISHTASQGSVQWYLDGDIIPGAQTDEISVSKSGIYTAAVTDTSSECPFVKNSDEIKVLAIKELIPVIAANSNYQSCISTSTDVSLIGVEAIAVNDKKYNLSADQVSRLTLNWYKSNTLQPEYNDKNKIEITSYKNSGDYFVEASIQSLKGKSEKVEISLLAADFKIVSSSNVICSSETINLKVEPLVDGFTYEWFKGEDKLDNLKSNLDITEADLYKVKVSGFGCEREISLEVKQFDENAVTITPSEVAVLSSDGTVEITADGADSYEWFNEKGDRVSLTNVYEASNIGTYTLIAKVKECSVEKKVKVVLDDGSFVIPNILTPFTRDGVNDTWQLPNKFAFQPEVQVLIYDSRGKEVLNTKDYQNNWPEDNNLKDGMLFYFKVIKENTLIKAGTISVLK